MGWALPAADAWGVGGHTRKSPQTRVAGAGPQAIYSYVGHLVFHSLKKWYFTRISVSKKNIWKRKVYCAGSRFLGSERPSGLVRAMRPGPSGSERPSTDWPCHGLLFFLFSFFYGNLFFFSFFSFLRFEFHFFYVFSLFL